MPKPLGHVIEFETEEQFTRLLEALGRELVDANIHWKLYKDLTGPYDLFSREYRQSWTFWSLTFQAHVDATLLRLIRVYDADSRSISLPNWLATISANLHIFDVERFRERLKNNPYVESLAEDVRRPDTAQLEEDLHFASHHTNPLVENMRQLRNKLIAHRDAESEIEEHQILADHSLSNDDIEELASRGMDVFNRYVSLFRASSFSTDIIGRGDYQYVLGTIRADLERRDQELENESVLYDSLKQEL